MEREIFQLVNTLIKPNAKEREIFQLVNTLILDNSLGLILLWCS